MGRGTWDMGQVACCGSEGAWRVHIEVSSFLEASPRGLSVPFSKIPRKEDNRVDFAAAQKRVHPGSPPER